MEEKYLIPDYDDLNEALMIDLALCHFEDKQQEECLSDEILAALVGKRLSAEKYESALKHVDQCESCYIKWLEITSICQEEEKKHKKYIKYSKQIIPTFMALAASILLVFYFAIQQEDLIEQSYNMALTNNTLFKELNKQKEIADLPWENSINNEFQPSMLAFGHFQLTTLQELSFGSGLWEGRKKVFDSERKKSCPDFLSPHSITDLDIKDWKTSPWSFYYELGKWCFLMKVLCKTYADIPSSLWHKQMIIIDYLKETLPNDKYISNLDRTLINEIFQEIKQELIKLEKTPGNMKNRHLVFKQLNKLIYHKWKVSK
ncbi:hypothetical protein MHK_006235 [Candidatus Magnetomorum sp. HK-1]|nr:hypothetical protein MHK_006235 [Candidatus Magnetomorum sp. HK-1]